MAKTYICENCGCTISATEKRYKIEGHRRYICRSCAKQIDKQNKQIKKDRRQYKALVRKQQEEARFARTGMRQTYFAMVAKILGGLLIITSMIFRFLQVQFNINIISAEPVEGLTIWHCIIGFLFGVMLIAAGLVPFLKRKHYINGE